MSRKKRSKKTTSVTNQGDSMGTVEGRVTYGAGYEDQNEESSGVSEGIDTAQNSTSSIGDTAQGVASAAVETAQDATSSVGETAGDVISSAAETVQQAATAVVDTAQQAASTVTGAVGDTVDQVSDTVATQVEHLADTVAQVAFSGDTPSVQRQVAETTVNVLDRAAEYLRTGNSDAVLEDLRAMVRLHPLRSLAIGLGLGYLARGAFYPGSGGQQAARARDVPGSAPLPDAVPVSRGESLLGYAAVDSGFTTTGYDAVYNSGSSVESSTAVIGTGMPDLADDIPGSSTLDSMGDLGTADDVGGAADTTSGPDIDADPSGDDPR